MFLRTNKMWRQPLNKNDHNWKFEKEETLHFCKWTVLRLRLLLQCPLKLSSESMVGRLKWLTSFTSFTKLSDQRTHVKSLVTVLLGHFSPVKDTNEVWSGNKIVNNSSWAEHIVLLCLRTSKTGSVLFLTCQTLPLVCALLLFQILGNNFLFKMRQFTA